MSNYKPSTVGEEPQEAVREKRAEKVATGTIRVKKKTEFQKFTEMFVSKDVGNIKTYIFMDVLIPAIKKAVSDIVRNGIDMLLYGEAGVTKGSTNASKVSYKQYYNSRDSDPRESRQRQANMTLDYDTIVYDTITDATAVIDDMNEILDRYNHASIADLYDLSGVTDNNYTHRDYGWTDLRGVKPRRLPNGGYMLDLPRVIPLK